ncbi:MAG: hypothetical protein V2B18_24720 [Pseudomonadota bacterium]
MKKSEPHTDFMEPPAGPDNPTHDTGTRHSCLCSSDPAILLDFIRRRFTDLGLYGQALSVEYEGVLFRVSCDDHAFTVYRVNSLNAGRHHAPGWPVCLVDSHGVFEEHCSPVLGDDHCSTGTLIENWLHILEVTVEPGSASCRQAGKPDPQC